MRVLVSDTSILIDQERADLLRAAFSLDAEFVGAGSAVRARTARQRRGPTCLRWACVLKHWTRLRSNARKRTGAWHAPAGPSRHLCIDTGEESALALLTGDGALRALAVAEQVGVMACSG